MKKLALLFGLMIAVVALISSCTSCKKEEKVIVKEEVAPTPPPPPAPISLEEFFVEAVAKANPDEMTTLKVPGYVFSDVEEIVLVPFAEKQTVFELKQVNKKYPLTITFKCDGGSTGLVYNYQHLCMLEKGDEEVLHLLTPMPDFKVFAGEEIYLIMKDGTEWPLKNK